MAELRTNGFMEVPGMAAPNEPHMACALLLDTSSSMSYGGSIDRLNRAVNDFISQTMTDELAKRRLDVAIIEFNDTANIVRDFTPLTQLEPVVLTATGCTAMGSGIELAIDKVKERCRFYDSMGTPCYKPWIFMITDGAPTDSIDIARQRIQEEEAKGSHGKLKFWAVGVPGYNKESMTSLTKRCIELSDTCFEGIFNWLSESMVAISVSKVDENPQLGTLPENARTIPEDW